MNVSLANYSYFVLWGFLELFLKVLDLIVQLLYDLLLDYERVIGIHIV